MDRHAAEVDRLRGDVLGGPGVTGRAAREAALRGTTTGPIAAYLALVQNASYRITGDDIAALRGAGISEDEIFELTVAAALGAAWRRLESAKRAMGRVM